MSTILTDGLPKEDAAGDQTWEAFKATRPNLQPHENWTQQTIPPELRIVDDEESLPEKLKQILAWSLIVNPVPATIDSHNSVREPQRDRTGEDRADENSALLHVANNHCSQSTTEHSEPDDVPASRSAQSKPPLNLFSGHERRNAKSRHLRYGILGPSLDLIAQLKAKVEKEPPSVPHTKKAPQRNDVSVECTSCFEEFPKPETAKLPCTHSYCKPCLTTLVTTALQNEQSYPPKCCLTEIPLQIVLLPLNTQQREAYREKAAEYLTPATERWYCPNASCLKWIAPGKIQPKRHLNQKCPHCATKICSICRGTAHSRSTDCPQDFGLEATISLAEQEGWRRCFKCRTMVERTDGCRHMTCKCGAQFCYSCGVKWRTCRCTDFGEANRQADLRRRRSERQATVDAEDAEFARVLAEVETMERREAEERRREEQRREAERQREEAELARLEEQRLQEEVARRAEEERLEREFQETLRLSVEETCKALQFAFDRITRFQKESLDQRHLQAERHHLRLLEADSADQQKASDDILQKLQSNINKRTAVVEAKQKSELDTFSKEQEELEDDLFLNIQTHLRGKTDKEARERRLQQKLQEQRKEMYENMSTRHTSETETLRVVIGMELGTLKRARNDKMAQIHLKYQQDLEGLLRRVAADRAWFKLLVQRRQNMVSASNHLMLEAVDGGEEPLGLSEEGSALIGPFTTDRQREPDATTMDAVETTGEPSTTKGKQKARLEPPWPPSIRASSSSSSQGPVELATTPEHLPPNIDRTRAVGGGRSRADKATASSDEFVMNSAWVWMTRTGDGHASLPNVARGGRGPGQHEIMARSAGVHQTGRATTHPWTEALMSGALPSSQQSPPPPILQPAGYRNESTRPQAPAVNSTDETPPVPSMSDTTMSPGHSGQLKDGNLHAPTSPIAVPLTFLRARFDGGEAGPSARRLTSSDEGSSSSMRPSRPASSERSNPCSSADSLSVAASLPDGTAAQKPKSPGREEVGEGTGGQTRTATR